MGLIDMKTKLYAIWDTHKLIAESQQVAVLPPSLKFMVSTFLILTQCKITENTAGSLFCTRQKNLPISFVCFSASIRALARLEYQGSHSLTEAIHKLIPTFPAEGYRRTDTQDLPHCLAKTFLQTKYVG